MFGLIVAAAAVAVAALFTVQNSGRTTDLSLDLWVKAFHLQEPQPIPYLLWAAFGIGLLVGGTWGLMGRVGSGSSDDDADRDESAAYNPADDDWT